MEEKDQLQPELDQRKQHQCRYEHAVRGRMTDDQQIRRDCQNNGSREAEDIPA
jgi:hypothetical protein